VDFSLDAVPTGNGAFISYAARTTKAGQYQATVRIGSTGICGWGGMALAAAAADPRIRATVASTMYDMSRVAAKGYFDSADSVQERNRTRESVAAQRTADYRSGVYAMAGGVVDPLPEDAPPFVKDYYDYYKTPRGYHPRSLNSNAGWTVIGGSSLTNATLLGYIEEIEGAVMIVHGEAAHSYYMGRDAFARLTGDNKEFVTIPGAVHADLVRAAHVRGDLSLTAAAHDGPVIVASYELDPPEPKKPRSK